VLINSQLGIQGPKYVTNIAYLKVSPYFVARLSGVLVSIDGTPCQVLSLPTPIMRRNGHFKIFITLGYRN